MGATPGQDSVCDGSDSLHTGADPRTVHDKLLTKKKTEPEISYTLLWYSSAGFVLLSLLRCALLVWCLVPVRSSARCLRLPALAAFSLPPWLLSAGALCFVVFAILWCLPGCFFCVGVVFSPGRATTPEPITFCRYSLRKLLRWFDAGWQDTQYWAGMGHRAVRDLHRVEQSCF